MYRDMPCHVLSIFIKGVWGVPDGIAVQTSGSILPGGSILLPGSILLQSLVLEEEIRTSLLLEEEINLKNIKFVVFNKNKKWLILYQRSQISAYTSPLRDHFSRSAFII